MPGRPISILPLPSVKKCCRTVALSIVALSALFPLPITTSAATVTISPPNNIKTAINANPNGTIFILPAGIWHRQQFTPKPGNQFIGDPAGRTILTGDDVTNAIYSSNGTSNLGVVWNNIVVEHYGFNVKACRLGAIHGVAGWTFKNATFRFNNCTGLNVGPDNKVIGGRFNDNRHAGIQGYKPHRTVIDGAEIARNNTRHDHPESDAAGVKLVHGNLLTMRNNYVHDNYGPGLWCDLSCSNVLIEGNTVVKNYGRGIFYEISMGRTIIRNNVSNDNGATFGRPQIGVNSSNGVEVYGNNVRASGVAGSIIMQAANRPDQLVTANNYFHNNVITITSNSSRFGFTNFGGSLGTGNSSNKNAFHVLNTSHSHFYWNTSSATYWTRYRSASGQDAGSTIQIGNASVPGNTQGCPALTGCGR